MGFNSAFKGLKLLHGTEDKQMVAFQVFFFLNFKVFSAIYD